MPKKRIQPNEKVPLKLTAMERKLVLNDLIGLDIEFETLIQSTPSGKPVMMTLGDLDDFSGCIAAEANHCEDKKKQKKLDSVFQKTQDLLDRYTDADNSTINFEQAKRKLTQALEDMQDGRKPQTVSFRMPPLSQRQQAEKFPIKITALQREAMISCTRLKAAIQRRLKDAKEGTQVIEFTRKELDHMREELSQASAYAPSQLKKRIISVRNKAAAILDELQLEALGIKQPKKQRRSSAQSDLLFQFKIILLDIKPVIWRRVQIRDCSLAELHEHVQAAMGWENYHLHQIIIDGERYGPPPSDDFDMDVIDEYGVALSNLLPKSGKQARWIYEYDFGDGWRHEIVFEGFPPPEQKAKYPLCLEGERACPPEDVGGCWGYTELLEALADPNHERHDEFMEWRGRFDPEAFDAKKMTAQMRKAYR